jgi:DNA mismatch repair protein MutS
MTRLEKTLPRLKNYTVSVKESAGKIIFVRKVVPGTADRSYGIHVAQIAGLPKAVVDRATKLLEGLEAQAKAPKQKTQKAAEGQLGLFG